MLDDRKNSVESERAEGDKIALEENNMQNKTRKREREEIALAIEGMKG